jgi:hypothetical protein
MAIYGIGAHFEENTSHDFLECNVSWASGTVWPDVFNQFILPS